MSALSKLLRARAKKTAGWSVKQVRGSFTSFRKMLVTIAIVIAVLAALDVLLAVLRSVMSLLATLLSNAIGDTLVHLELHQDWFALAGGFAICLIGVLAAARGIRAVHSHGRPEQRETYPTADRTPAPMLNGAPEPVPAAAETPIGQ
jgi:hypothetical protein